MPDASLFTLAELTRSIHAAPSKHRQKAIAIDGGGGAGKTTFARHLAEKLGDSEIIAIDDFFKGSMEVLERSDHYTVNPIFDWDRFSAQVIDPLRDGRQITYQKYDWDADSFNEAFIAIPLEAVVIIEGAYSTQKRFRDFYDRTFWIEAEEPDRLARILIRDGVDHRALWEEKLLPAERNYRDAEAPKAYVDMVIDGLRSTYEDGSLLVLKN